MSESETTSASNWKVIRDGEAGRRDMHWEEVTFTLDFCQFVALKGLNSHSNKTLLRKNSEKNFRRISGKVNYPQKEIEKKRNFKLTGKRLL